MTVEIRTGAGTDELKAALGPIWHYFGRAVSDEDAERMARILPPERTHAAYVDGSVVGGAGAYDLEMTIPGGVARVAGVMGVGVLPTHRRRGILTALMRRQLDDARERGEPLAMLYASEGAIYRRYGYGPASLQGDFELEREYAAFQPPVEPAGAARIVGLEEALEAMPAVYDRVRRQTPGMLARSRDWWEVRRLTNPPWARGEQVLVVVDLDGRPEGYAIYRLEMSVEHMMSKTVLEVREAIGATPPGTRDVWRFIFGVDWVDRIRGGFLPIDHPLFLLLAEPRRMHFTVGEALWVRLVDIGAGLSARGYAQDGEVVFDVSDPFCPWNEGRWRLAGGRAQRTDAEPDLRLGVDVLGSAYLGGFRFQQLERAGRVEELTSGAIERADRLFATDRAPWCPEIF